MKVLIVGGGFGGLNVAKGLGGDPRFEVTLIDRRNYHLFQPLLYQVAMAGLSPAEIAVPIRAELSHFANVDVLLANVQRVLPKDKIVETDIGRLSYDVLVLACGAKHSYFGHPEWEPLAPGLKTLEQATEIRRRVLMAFEWAEREHDPELRRQRLTFVVVGGGPTGVELAGAIGEISRYTLAKDFKHITPQSARIVLIEAGDRILSAFDASLSVAAQRSLEGLGVQVWTGARVTQITEEGVAVGSEFLRARTVLWAAGVQASSLNAGLGAPLDRAGRVRVNRELQLAHDPNIFVIGDQAWATSAAPDGKDGAEGPPLPGLSPVAIQQGRYVARWLRRQRDGKPQVPFRYFDKGIMATVGRRFAILQVGRLKMAGLLAWLGWIFVHIYYLIGFRNRLFVFLQWSWHYLRFGRGARLIMHKEWRSHEPHRPT